MLFLKVILFSPLMYTKDFMMGVVLHSKAEDLLSTVESKSSGSDFEIKIQNTFYTYRVNMSTGPLRI